MSDELRIKIILDDGSVKEGFLSAEKQAEKSGKKIGKSFDEKGSGLNKLAEGTEAVSGGLTSMAQAAIRATGPIGAATAGVAALAAATFKMALAGEQVNAVNLQFANIASSAGLAADSFKESIIGATQGLIDDEDALQIATKGIVALGDQASKLPAILDASRGVSRALGKDFKSTFEDLSTFVENGNARVLRQFGIVLDLEKAYAAAAKSIGLTAAALTEQQKQQIRANLILDEVPKKFDAASQSVTPLKDAFDRLKVSASNSLESIQSGLANFITQKFIDNADLSNVATSRLRNNLEAVSKEITSVSSRIEEIKLDKLGSKSVQASAEVASLNTELKRLREEQQKLFLEQSARSDQELFSALDASKGSGSNKETIKATAEQTVLAKQEQLKRLNDLQAYVSAQDKLVLDAEIKRIDSINNLDQRLTAQKSAFAQQSILLEQQKNAALNQINEQFSSQKGFSQEQRDLATLATKQNYYLQEQALAQANADKIKSIEDNKNMSVSGGFIAAADGMKMAAQDFANNSVSKFQELGKQSFATLGQGVGKAFNNFGAALKSGADAGKAFESAIGDTIAGVASQFGDLFIQTGIGKLAMSYGADATGYTMIAAGAALKLLVGMSGAGGSTASSAASDGGGGIASTPTTTTDLTPTQDLERAAATTGVSVVIQGDVLDSQESGSRIVNLINEAFSHKGVVINQGVMA
jgi:hypothetical protein